MQRLKLSVDGHALGEWGDSGLQRRRPAPNPEVVIRRPVTSLVQCWKKLPLGTMSYFTCHQSFYYLWPSKLTSAQILNTWYHEEVEVSSHSCGYFVCITTDFLITSFVLVVTLIQWCAKINPWATSSPRLLSAHVALITILHVISKVACVWNEFRHEVASINCLYSFKTFWDEHSGL